ncbi:arginine repressor [Vagococcus entomophilus]|uniref:Arginine repressor n=1 Tax=Vagococcus entomophilus TaxID=1160095 RepID=A0A430AI78_9ENTE|nr:ArgR family transcriptional regulator [Vagococcus entomophilus]RSU07819.1 ArgR family transcriptional regulator [Vagococcus entomophilus]
MKKKDRHRLIQKMIHEHEIQKQEEFVERLRATGIEVTQATISRDIKDLHLVKVPSSTGGYCYSLPTSSEPDLQQKTEKLLKDCFLNIQKMDKFLAIQTIPGSAVALGNLLEKVYEEQLFTAMTNDNKVLLITKTNEDATALEQHILEQV